MHYKPTQHSLAGRLLALLLLVLLAAAPAVALQGADGAHDPSTIVKRDGVYHVWTTGDQIYHLTSTDLVTWKPAPTVFAAGTWPGWVGTYVQGFKGNFWAPECVLRNGTYYMYYSCSLGGRPSAIGLTTSTDLTNWTDQSVVVYSDNNTPWGAIDPDVFTDADGKLWMTFGSHLSGIWLIQLDPATGKRLDSNIKNIAGASPYCENEASYVMQHGGYYYLFYNKGICCAGVNSTYYVQMGRATSPAGPYLDKNGVDLLQGGGSNFLVTNGKYIGPGQVGLFEENGANYLTYHYYDRTRNGAPTLGIGSLSWDAANWPAVTENWLPAGTYTLTSQGSGLLWASASCPAAAGQALVQSPASGQPCQQWKLLPQSSGLYKIANVASASLYVDQTNCAEDAGTKLALQASSALNCQQFQLVRAADGSYVLEAQYGNRVIEVPNASLADGQQLGLWDYSACTCQHWLLNAVGSVTAVRSALDAGLQLYPNPAREGNFAVQLPAGSAATLTVLDISGRVVYRQLLPAGSRADVRAGLAAGAYVVRVATAEAVATRKLLVQ